MKTELNNTGILLADLNETEVKIAIELYRLCEHGSEELTKSKVHNYIGIYDDELGFWVGNGCDGMKPITMHQLAFESGLNPDWADEVCVVGCFMMWSNGRSYQYISNERFNIDEQIIIKKQTQEWPEENRINATGQNGNNGEHYELTPQNSNEFVMRCKRTGKPVIADFYAIAKALPNLSPEVGHSLKKI